MYKILSVSSPQDILSIAELASSIWNDHFVPLIGQEQVDYMLEKFQSNEAITAQIKNGYEYYMVVLDGLIVAYMALLADVSSGKMMLSKFYVQKNMRGNGLGKRLLRFAIDRSREKNLNTIWLTVNKDNKGSIEWYLKRGFVISDKQKKDIGHSYFMDDYIMEINTSNS